MKTQTKLLLGSISAAFLIVGVALATPTVGAWYNVILSTGTVNQDIHRHAHVALPGKEEGFSAEIETDGAANFIVQDSWTEGAKLHDVVNTSSVDAHFVVTYVVAKGVNKRTDQPAPACAVALGLN
jgi:hypothetical protein